MLTLFPLAMGTTLGYSHSSCCESWERKHSRKFDSSLHSGSFRTSTVFRLRHVRQSFLPRCEFLSGPHLAVVPQQPLPAAKRRKQPLFCSTSIAAGLGRFEHLQKRRETPAA